MGPVFSGKKIRCVFIGTRCIDFDTYCRQDLNEGRGGQKHTNLNVPNTYDCANSSFPRTHVWYLVIMVMYKKR